MIHYVIFHRDIPVGIATSVDRNQLGKVEGWRYETPHDWKSFERVTELARLLEATTKRKFLPVDNGSHTSPRYGLVEPPKLGDEVSYSFNGDTYPDGVITKITPKYHITTSEGHKYRRRGNRGYWLREGGTWSLVAGHIYEQNPSF